MPLLRPLLGWEKQEIIDEARALGTAAVSVLPDEDCCSLLAPRQVSTRARVADLRRVEQRPGPAGLAEELLAGAWTLAPGADEVPAADTAGAERAGRV
ncbi:thiamine biosynthesis protein ThiI [Streptomyces qinglanensis]|uniref:Thiamine biosynthesis protein ThiI n=1 Tax=Streptomyces qinglanensis TaxID=943816 RepID=A0A1H9TEH4_9ACTN|nr:thiamine biosynthesis protein ThiI [Streptomyces qinglanensis]